VLIGAII